MGKTRSRASLRIAPRRQDKRSIIRALPAPLRLYRRSIDLPKLVAMWPGEIADTSTAGRLRLIAKLRSALRAERRRGIAGHWTYDLARHQQLLAAYRAEVGEGLGTRD